VANAAFRCHRDQPITLRQDVKASLHMVCAGRESSRERNDMSAQMLRAWFPERDGLTILDEMQEKRQIGPTHLLRSPEQVDANRLPVLNDIALKGASKQAQATIEILHDGPIGLSQPKVGIRWQRVMQQRPIGKGRLVQKNRLHSELTADARCCTAEASCISPGCLEPNEPQLIALAGRLAETLRYEPVVVVMDNVQRPRADVSRAQRAMVVSHNDGIGASTLP